MIYIRLGVENYSHWYAMSVVVWAYDIINQS